MERKNKKTKSVGNGEGSLYYSETLKRWVFQYCEPSGKRKTIKQKQNETNKHFKDKVVEIKVSLNDGTYIGNNKDTLYQIIKHHVEQKYDDKLVSDVSYKRNLDTLAQLEICAKGYIRSPIQRVKIEDIEQSKKIMSSSYSQSSINKMWRLLNKGFAIAYARRKIKFNIMADPDLKKPLSNKESIKVEALTVDEQKKFEELLDSKLKNHKYRNIIKLQLETGMRIGEVLARSKNDFDKDTGNLFVGNTLTKDKNDKVILGRHTKTYDRKTGIDWGKRTLPLSQISPESQQIIIEELNKKVTNIHGLFFWNYKTNSFITYNEINSWLRRINEKYKITNKKFSTHVLRHTRITRWIESGLNMAVVQYLAGHVDGSDITNNVYFTLTEDFITQEAQKYQKHLKETVV